MSSILDWKKLLKQHGFTESQVRAWAERKYPMFANNIPLMAYLFLQEKGVEIKPVVRGVYQPKKVCELVIGDRAEIQVLVGAKLGEVQYYGCPECYTKVEEREGKFYCPKCQKFVEQTVLAFKRYIAGDDTDNIVVVIPPYVEGDLEVGKYYKLRGRVNDNREFSIREYEELPLEVPSVEKAKEEEVIEVEIPVGGKEKEEEETGEGAEGIAEVEVPEAIETEEVEEVEEVKEEIEEKPEKAEEGIEVLPELRSAKISDEEKRLATKIYEFIASKGGVVANEILKEFGDRALVLLTVLRQAGLIELKKTKRRYVFVPKVRKEQRATGKEGEEKEEEVEKKERVVGVQAKLFEGEPSLDEVGEKVRKMLSLFGGSINLEDFEKWYKNQPFAKKVPLEEILRADWIEVKDGVVSLK